MSVPGFSDHGASQAEILEWDPPSPGDRPILWIESASPVLQVKSLP